MTTDIKPLEVRCTALYWGGSVLVGLPGEVFAQSALRLRDSIAGGMAAECPVFMIAYADDNRVSRQVPSTVMVTKSTSTQILWTWRHIAPGSAERLEQTGCLLAKNAAVAATQNQRAINNTTIKRGNNG